MSSLRMIGLIPISSLFFCFTTSAIKPKPDASSAYFVATNGNDGWSGKIASPTRNRTDGPFLSVTRALEVIRNARKQNSTDTSNPTLFLREGYHFLEQPLILTPRDSGLLLTAYRSEKPVISGGRRIDGWTAARFDDRTLWVADVPLVREGKWIFRELWVNGKRAQRSRHPNRGYLKVEGLLDKVAQWSEGVTRFRYSPDDMHTWRGITNSDLVVMSRWVESRLPVRGIDAQERVLTFGKRSVFELSAGDPYYIEGALELLDQPGEWFLDAALGKVFYMPRKGENMDHIEAIAPFLPQILRFEGQPGESRFVADIIMQGLSFAHCEWFFPEVKPDPEKPQAGGFSQAAIGVPGAVWAEGLRNSAFDNCRFIHLGSYGMELGRGCQSNRVADCEFGDLGGGGIKLGESAIRESPKEWTKLNVITNCHIHDGGKMFHSAIGVWIGQSPDNALVRNSIHDFYYTGISIGWTWGYGASIASNNLVAFNHIHHIGIKSDGDGPILSDMGGIYTLGKQPGTRVINNLWHDIAGANYGGWGIYFDEGSSGILATSNVVYRTTHGGFHQHYGETNTIRNNIFAFGRDQQLQRSRVEPHVSFSFETNIVCFDSGDLLGSEWADDHFVTDWNLYWDTRLETKPGELKFGKALFDEWRKRGHDQHSIIADPGFGNPQKGDFGFKSDSPALRVGFQPINVTTVGATTESKN